MRGGKNGTKEWQEWTPSVSEKSRVKGDARHTQAAGLMNGIQKRLPKPAA